MPEFKTLNPVETIKPGASILARATAADGASQPALVVQQFGRGRTAALLIGDLWRWNLHRTDHKQSDLEKSWRQTGSIPKDSFTHLIGAELGIRCLVNCCFCRAIALAAHRRHV
jgi:uncharacterized membrane protein